MKVIIRDMKEMTDSREMLESKASPFVAIFIYMLIFIIVVAITWTYFGEMDTVVKASGVVRPDEKVSSIQSKVLGNVEHVYFKAGQKVKQGELLYTLERDDLESQKNALLVELHRLQEELRHLETFKRSVETGENYFSNDVEGEKDYYDRFVKYQTDYEKLETELERTNLELQKAKKDTDLNHKTLSVRLEETQEMLGNLNLLEQSILQQTNLFTERDKEFYNRYIDYDNNLQQLTAIAEQRNKNYEISKALGEEYIPRVQIEDEKKQLEAAMLELARFKNEYLLQVRTSIDENYRKANELQLSLEKTSKTFGESILDTEISMNKEYTQVMLDKYKIDTSVEISSGIKAQEDKIVRIEEQIDNVNISLQDHMIKAPISGTIHVNTDINKGDLVTTGTDILTIVPQSRSQYKIVTSVSNQDIAEVKVGDEIKYHFLSLPYKEYGELTGRITKISIDSNVNPQNGGSYYTVEATIDNKPLFGYKGQEAAIKVGMVCEAFVITDSKKILYSLLEKIDLRE